MNYILFAFALLAGILQNHHVVKCQQQQSSLNNTAALFYFLQLRVEQAFLDIQEEIDKDEQSLVTYLPKYIPHSFNVSFVFPNKAWSVSYEDNVHDDYHCFKEEIERKLKTIYYDGDVEYVGASLIQYRNESLYSSYITADFILHFQKSILWPAWNKPKAHYQFGFADFFPFQPIRESYNPYVNYTQLEIEWFDIIKDEKNMFGSEGAFAYFGYYNYTPPAPVYTGPEYTSILNLLFYAFISFNIFVVLFAICFWGINQERQKLLMSYWVKETRDEKAIAEKTPGDF